ncbi:MAG: hypothetical protein BWY02_02067 [bacterium ADurb.Bin157]|nr:MAG: hypothetical protein BWY02_02067 [bacterium ADurb.Bin157]
MIENNPTNVMAAFEILLEEVEAEIDFVNHVGAKGFEKRDYDSVKEAMEHAGKITAFRDRVHSLRKEWETLTAAPVSQEMEEQRKERQNLGRLQRGLRTREESYYKPILQTLIELNGSGKVINVLDRVGQIMKNTLKKPDYEPLASGNDTPRWRNAAQWARNSMVNDGLLKNDSPRGVWEISDKGRKFLEG